MARTKKTEQSAATLGFEAELWSAADEMRGHVSAAEYRQVLTGLIFLRYVSAAFDRRFNELKDIEAEYQKAKTDANTEAEKAKTEAELAKVGISQGSVRLSIGCEHADDIIADLRQAFEALA